jgi:hypothetical protein
VAAQKTIKGRGLTVVHTKEYGHKIFHDSMQIKKNHRPKKTHRLDQFVSVVDAENKSKSQV